ncbi:MAG: hypothetical protein IJJ00_01185 [Erysipelotrichaceae bacterium]|nr:hypothetical protein [Erysipelotrichaceae bacterium]
MYDKYILKGNDYEIGVKAGKIFKKPINEEIGIYVKMLEDEKTSAITDKIILTMEKELPRCLQEIYGRADGAAVDPKAMVLFYSPEVYTKVDGCTTAVFKKDDRVLFCHNEDDIGCNHENRNLMKLDYGDFWLVGMGDYHKLHGSNFGYNSKGLVFSCNYLFHDEVNLDFLSRYIVSRDVVESGSIEECLAKLNKHKPASAFSYNVMDIKANEAVNVENDLDNMYVTRIEGRFARSNHFLNKENAIASENSRYRYRYANERLAKVSDDAKLQDLVDVLSYENEEYVQSILMDPLKYPDKKDNTVTVANFAFDSLTKEIHVRDYLDHSECRLDYDDFDGREYE